MKSSRGVYIDINESVYFTDFLQIRFYFSSKFYQRIFSERIENFINIEIKKIKDKYKVDISEINFNDIIIDLKRYLAISLYKRIEKRGFRIYFLVNTKE